MDSRGWDDRYATKDYVWKLAPNQFVEEHLRDLTPGAAVDMAAGEGRNAVWLASLGWDVTAVDFSPVGLDKANQLATENDVTITTVIADATTWQPEEPLDLVVLAYLQLPTNERLTVLSHVESWLKPGGTVFIIAHDQSNVADGHGGPSDPDVCYTPAETADALAGLEVTTAEVVERYVDTDDGTATALDTLVIATKPAPTS